MPRSGRGAASLVDHRLGPCLSPGVENVDFLEKVPANLASKEKETGAYSSDHEKREKWIVSQTPFYCLYLSSESYCIALHLSPRAALAWPMIFSGFSPDAMICFHVRVCQVLGVRSHLDRKSFHIFFFSVCSGRSPI